MKIYFDTGLLLKVYAAETNSVEAAALVQIHGLPLVFCQLQQTELRNALYRKAARKEIDRKQLANSLGRIESDLAADVLEVIDLEWREVWKKADLLTAKFAFATQCRTLDALHVAAAIQLGIKVFGTTDGSQLTMARKAGLKVVTLPQK